MPDPVSLARRYSFQLDPTSGFVIRCFKESAWIAVGVASCPKVSLTLCNRPGSNGGEEKPLGRAVERGGVERSNCSPKGFERCEANCFGRLPLCGAISRAKDGREGDATCSDPSFLALPVGCNDCARRLFEEGAVPIHISVRTHSRFRISSRCSPAFTLFFFFVILRPPTSITDDE